MMDKKKLQRFTRMIKIFVARHIHFSIDEIISEVSDDEDFISYYIHIPHGSFCGNLLSFIDIISFDEEYYIEYLGKTFIVTYSYEKEEKK